MADAIEARRLVKTFGRTIVRDGDAHVEQESSDRSRRRPPHSAAIGLRTPHVFGRRCRLAGIELSMGSTGYDNAVCEAFFKTLNAELVDRRSWPIPDPAPTRVASPLRGTNAGNEGVTELAQVRPDDGIWHDCKHPPA